MKIITPATVEPITLATARQHCKVDPETDPDTGITSSYDDPLIAIYLTAARQWAEGYLGRILAPVTVETVLSAFPAAAITLEATPVLSLTSLTYADAGSVDRTIDVAGLVLDRDAGTLTSPAAWPAGTNVRIRYVVGYSVEGAAQLVALPRTVMAAMLLMLAHMYVNRENATTQSLSPIPMGAQALLDLSGLRVRRGFA